MVLHIFPFYFILQLDQEMDLILGTKDVLKTAVNSWRMKWVPAVLSYVESLTSKSAKAAMQEAKTMFEGMQFWYISLVPSAYIDP